LSNTLYQFILAVIYAVFSVRLQIDAWLFVFIVLAVFAFGGIGMILTRVANEAESAAAAAHFLMFPTMFLSGEFLPPRDDAGLPADDREGYCLCTT